MKKTLYPKTTRIKNEKVIITEKLDGSNLWFFMINWKLLIAQRNNIFTLDELNIDEAYKWLIWWLEENYSKLDLHEWSWIFWEWIGMWKIWYWETLDKRFYIFAKANIDEELEIRNLNYNRDLFKYPFIQQEIPECMSIVPLIENDWDISIDSLDRLYESHLNKVWRKVEWFVINNSNQITKYVRYKDWKETSHKS